MENAHFLDLVETLRQIDPLILTKYKPPCSQTLTRITVTSVHEDLDKVKKQLLKDTDSVLLIDGWKNKNTNRKLLTCTLRNKTISQAFLSATDHSEESEYADDLARHIVAAVKLARSKYETNVFATVTDNDAKIKAGTRMASSQLLHQNFITTALLQSTCNSHSANLLIEDIVPEEFTTKLKEIIKVFKTPRMSSLLHKYGGCKLEDFPGTRWCYVRQTCQCIYESLAALIKIIDSIDGDRVPADIKNLVKSDDFQRQIVQTIRTLTPICKLINNCQNPDINVADGTEQWLSLQLDTDQYDEIISDRINKAIAGVGYAANLVHHIYQGDRLDSCQRQVAVEYLKKNLSDSGKAQLTHFLENRHDQEKAEKSCDDPYYYWNLCEFSYPELGRLCKRIMLIPASTALLEGYFSQWTYVHSKARNRLGSNVSSTLADVYHLCKHVDGDSWVNTVNKKRRAYHMDVEEDFF